MENVKIDKGSMAERDMDAFNDGSAEAESRGGDHKPIQDNGTQSYNFNTQGQMTGRNDFPTIPDNFSSTNKDYGEKGSTEVSDFGLNESVEVAGSGNQLQYGLVGESPSAGGKGEQGQSGEGSYKNRQQ